MANETDTTSLTELVQAEIVEMAIKDYLIDLPVVNPLCQYRSIAGQGSKAMSFPTWVKDTAVDITESTAMSNNQLETTEVSVTVAQVGILREVTDFVADTAKIGAQALFNAVLRDGTLLVTEMLEDDLCALFASSTGATIGTSGVDLSLANWAEAVAKARTLKLRGKLAAVLDDQQALDLMTAVMATTGAVFGGGNIDQSVLNAGTDGFIGSLMNVPIWVTNLTDTADAGANVVGTMFVTGSSNEANCPYTWVELHAPRVRSRVEPSMPSLLISTVFSYGVGITFPAASEKIVTDA